jgi:predicted ATPase/DNA-binding SARP family transcriptional activator
MALLRLFGHPVLERDGERAPLGVPPKAVALAAIVAANFTRPLSREWLAKSLWPDVDPADARANLRRHFHLLTKAIAEDLFILNRHTAQWNAACAVAVDVVRFDALADSEPALAVQEYAGVLCAGIDDEVLDPLRLRYRSAYEALMRSLIDTARDAGDDAALAVWLQHAINHDPLDEAAVRELMLLRRRHGDRAGALREYSAFAQRLRSELASEPEAQTQALFSEIAGENPTGLTPHNLHAPATTFVGRERELAEVAQAFKGSRVVTLIGPGGIGKTRLATRYCFGALPMWREGIWFVELQHAANEGSAWERIGSAMHLPAASETRVLEHLAGKRALIVLDTCEHLHDAVRNIVRRITQETPACVLATSRRALRVAQERIVDLGPLEIPPVDLHAGESPLRYGAYRLFLERAAMIEPTFRASTRNLRALAEILQRVDGLPLAIELVASRANVLTIEGMRKRLAATMKSARSAGDARAQTIDDTIAWSYELLTEDQRALFAWLSVFRARFSVEDVERVCTRFDNALESLFELIDASLVAVVPGEGDVHYRLLETTRAFAFERLLQSEAAHEAMLAHAQHAAEKADALRALSNAQYDLAVQTITGDISDYLAALERCVQYRWVALGARILEGLHRYGLRRHYCRELLRLTLALLETPQADAHAQARLHRFVGGFAPVCGLLELARTHTEKACSFYRERGEDSRLCEALSALAIINYESGAYAQSEELLLEVRERAHETGDEAMLGKTLGRLGALYLAEGDFSRALAYLVPAACGLRKLGETQQHIVALKNLAVAAHYAGDQAQAIEYADEALRLPAACADIGLHAMLLCVQGSAYRELGNLDSALRKQRTACGLLARLGETSSLAECFEDLASTFASIGELAQAARLLGYCEALRQRIGTDMNPGLRAYYERTVRLLKRALGEEYGMLHAAGAATSLDEHVASATAVFEGANARTPAAPFHE